MALSPSIIILYGAPKVGKSFDAMAALGGSCAIVESKGAASDVARSGLGFEPPMAIRDNRLATNADYFLATVEGWHAQGFFTTCPGIYVDDATLLLGDSMVGWRDEAIAAAAAAAARNEKNVRIDARWEYRCLDRTLSRMRRFGREIPAWLVMSFHEHEPFESNGVVVTRGAPEVPSSNKLDVVPASAHAVYHVEADPRSLDPWWPKCYSGNPMDPKWIMADRNDILSRQNPTAPMNLREILGSRGTWMPRPKGLEFLDDWAQNVTDSLTKGVRVIDIHTAWKKDYAGKMDFRHLRWALRDGIARYTLGLNRLSPFDLPATAGGSNLPAGGPPVNAAPAASK